MSILVNADTKVLVQGITGGFGGRHAGLSLDYGTALVAGVTPGKGGQTFEHGDHKVPVYDTVSDAVKQTGATTSAIFVPPPFAADAILEAVDAYDLSLADQALLGALILSEGYQQDVFSSRDINDIIEESGRPRIAHVTSAISGLTDRAYLTGTTKALSLSREGRAKARGLIGMVRRRAA